MSAAIFFIAEYQGKTHLALLCVFVLQLLFCCFGWRPILTAIHLPASFNASFGTVVIHHRNFCITAFNGLYWLAMLRIVVCASSAQAKNYFKKSLSREEYYSEGQELVGQWQGYGAERLGLNGRVDQRSFNDLADNLKPETDETLTARMKENRRVGYDFNFNCPKSVSVVYEQQRDERIVSAFKYSVHSNHARGRN